MKFRVRPKDGTGELEYSSFGQVEQAWLLGLIEPDDELLEEGKTTWRKANSFPLLVRARRSGDQVWLGTWFAWVVLGVTFGTIALILLTAKPFHLDLGGGTAIDLSPAQMKVAGMVLAFLVVGVMLKVTTNAHQRSKPHR